MLDASYYLFLCPLSHPLYLEGYPICQLPVWASEKHSYLTNMLWSTFSVFQVITDTILTSCFPLCNLDWPFITSTSNCFAALQTSTVSSVPEQMLWVVPLCYSSTPCLMQIICLHSADLDQAQQSGSSAGPFWAHSCAAVIWRFNRWDI